MIRATYRWTTLAAAFLLLAPWSGPLAREQLAGPVEARVVRVVDGDTLDVRARVWLGQEVATLVRVVGINAPERTAPCAAERAHAGRALRFLSDLFARDPTAVLTEIRHDKYGGRILARVRTAAGDDVGTLLVAAGMAVAYAGGPRAPWCGGPAASPDPP